MIAVLFFLYHFLKVFYVIVLSQHIKLGYVSIILDLIRD